ncbi:unnamed protein product [Candidula unifasciata]|uniref:RNA helicase n=1 Tax=Candidula unifasciata TaxID=100452 RepID=A0A8S3ZPZ1_9EUPU|nr:unnamed protein product [Candidula unifasciata]
MAKCVGLKEKSAWTTLSIPQELFNSQQFDHLVEIQELTDYELLHSDVDLNVSTTISKLNLLSKRKRPRKWSETVAVATVGVVEPSHKQLKKKRKQAETVAVSTVDVVEPSYKQSKKKRKQAETVAVSTVDVVEPTHKQSKKKRKQAETVVASTVDVVEPTHKQSKKKRKQAETVVASTDDKVEPSHKPSEKVINQNYAQSQVFTERPATEDCSVDTSKSHQNDADMSQWKNLYVPDVLLPALKDEGFDVPTPIQNLVLPSAIRDMRDILAAAETGSGKTLAFGIPIFARILRSRLAAAKTKSPTEEDDLDTQPPMALILEPTRELAVQVKRHLTALGRYTDITFATVVGGMSIEKQRRVLGKRPHVIIATPGRLWQLVEEGNEHLCQIDKVLCLVVDEADRMIEKGHYVANNRQTFVMSATLTMDVTTPKRLTKKKKKKILTERICIGQKPKVIDLTPKDKVAQTLTELRVNCKADEKVTFQCDFILQSYFLCYFLCHHPGRTLVFANSKDCLRRLVALLTLLKCCPLPLHADMQQRQRLKNLDRFAENSRGLLVASDVAARGLDIANVDHVIHYQVPRTMENYIHRSGRTARASNLGLSVMLVSPEDARDYRKIVHGVRNGEELPILPVDMDLLPAVRQRVALARNIDVTEYRLKKKRLRNNFFTKAAEEMDMVIDESHLLEDTGDEVMQAEEKHLLKQMKAQLSSMLQRSLAPQHMTKYPTKSGHLLSKTVVNLHRIK